MSITAFVFNIWHTETVQPRIRFPIATSIGVANLQANLNMHQMMINNVSNSWGPLQEIRVLHTFVFGTGIGSCNLCRNF